MMPRDGAGMAASLYYPLLLAAVAVGGGATMASASASSESASHGGAAAAAADEHWIIRLWNAPQVVMVYLGFGDVPYWVPALASLAFWAAIGWYYCVHKPRYVERSPKKKMR